MVIPYVLQLNKSLVGVFTTFILFSFTSKEMVGEYLLFFYLSISISAALSIPLAMHVARSMSRSILQHFHNYEARVIYGLTILFFLSLFFNLEKIIGFILISVISFYLSMRAAYFNIDQKKFRFSLILNIFPLLRLIFILIGIYCLDEVDVEGLVTLTVLAVLISYIIVSNMGMRLSVKDGKEKVSDLIKYMGGATVLGVCYTNGEKFILSGILDFVALAEYFFALQITYLIITNFLSPIVQLYYPVILNDAENRDYLVIIKKLDKFILLAALLYLIIMVFFSEFIVSIINKEYLNVTKYLWITIISGAIFVMAQVRCVAFSKTGNEKYHLYSTLVATGFGLLVVTIFVSLFSVEGAMFANLTYTLFYLSIVNYCLKKVEVNY